MTNKRLGDADIISLSDSGNYINKIIICSETLFVTEKTQCFKSAYPNPNLCFLCFWILLSLLKGGGVGVMFVCLCTSAHAHVSVGVRGVHELLIHVRLHVLFVYVLANFSFFFPPVSFVHVSKTAMSCYGDWDTCIKRKWQKREMWLSGDTLGPWGWGWKSEPAECLCACVCVDSRFRFSQQWSTFIFSFLNSSFHTNLQRYRHKGRRSPIHPSAAWVCKNMNPRICSYMLINLCSSSRREWGCDPSRVDRG